MVAPIPESTADWIPGYLVARLFGSVVIDVSTVAGVSMGGIGILDAPGETFETPGIEGGVKPLGASETVEAGPTVLPKDGNLFANVVNRDVPG